MGYKVAKPFSAWTASDGSLGGYITKYDTGFKSNFTYITVRGAGHMVRSPRGVSASPACFPPPPLASQPARFCLSRATLANDPNTQPTHAPLLNQKVPQTAPLYAYDIANAYVHFNEVA